MTIFLKPCGVGRVLVNLRQCQNNGGNASKRCSRFY